LTNFGGAYLRMGAYPNTLKVFLPNPPDVRQAFSGYVVGDTVRVTGIAYQYCPIPPHVDQFELLIGDVRDVARVSARWIPQLRALWPILVVLAAMGFLWWRRG